MGSRQGQGIRRVRDGLTLPLSRDERRCLEYIDRGYLATAWTLFGRKMTDRLIAYGLLTAQPFQLTEKGMETLERVT